MSDGTFGIVGGGIVGLAVAREIARRSRVRAVVVFEKEDRVGVHQTGHNSGVVHAGIYYRPGSLKAQLCTRGRLLLREYCAEHGLPYVECGKLVVAVDAAEVRSARRAGADRAAQRRAGAEAGGGLRDHRDRAARGRPRRAALPGDRDHRLRRRGPALRQDVEAAGGRVLLSTTVTGIDRRSAGVDVESPGRRPPGGPPGRVCRPAGRPGVAGWVTAWTGRGSCRSAAST